MFENHLLIYMKNYDYYYFLFFLQGCPKDYNEYVIYDNRRAMIDYIITFRVNQQGQDRLRERVPSPLFDSQGKGSIDFSNIIYSA